MIIYRFFKQNNINYPFSFLPQTFALLSTNRSTVLGWSPALYLTTGILGLANLVFIVFGTSQVQEWNTVKSNTKPQEEEPNETTSITQQKD